jgi:hypothetical protein
MAEKFFAEMLARSEINPASQRLELSICDVAGQSMMLSVGPDVIAALAQIMLDLDPAAGSRARVTKMPRRYAVGHGRHEPYVMLRFEDDAAYGLSPAQAANLGEALLEEAEALADACPPTRQ